MDSFEHTENLTLSEIVVFFGRISAKEGQIVSYSQHSPDDSFFKYTLCNLNRIQSISKSIANIMQIYWNDQRQREEQTTVFVQKKYVFVSRIFIGILVACRFPLFGRDQKILVFGEKPVLYSNFHGPSDPLS